MQIFREIPFIKLQNSIFVVEWVMVKTRLIRHSPQCLFVTSENNSAYRPQRRGGLLGTGTRGEGEEEEEWRLETGARPEDQGCRGPPPEQQNFKGPRKAVFVCKGTLKIDPIMKVLCITWPLNPIKCHCHESKYAYEGRNACRSGRIIPIDTWIVRLWAWFVGLWSSIRWKWVVMIIISYHQVFKNLLILHCPSRKIHVALLQ